MLPPPREEIQGICREGCAYKEPLCQAIMNEGGRIYTGGESTTMSNARRRARGMRVHMCGRRRVQLRGRAGCDSNRVNLTSALRTPSPCTTTNRPFFPPLPFCFLHSLVKSFSKRNVSSYVIGFVESRHAQLFRF